MDKMKELEEKERERYKSGRKKVMSDLNMINQKILEENNNRKEKERNEKLNADNSFFPFVNGDQIEAHRAKINS